MPEPPTPAEQSIIDLNAATLASVEAQTRAFQTIAAALTYFVDRDNARRSEAKYGATSKGDHYNVFKSDG